MFKLRMFYWQIIKFKLQMFYWRIFSPNKYKELKKAGDKLHKICKSEKVQDAFKQMIEAVFNKVKDNK